MNQHILPQSTKHWKQKKKNKLGHNFSNPPTKIIYIFKSVGTPYEKLEHTMIKENVWSIPLYRVTPISYKHAGGVIVRWKYGRRATNQLQILSSRCSVKGRLCWQVWVQNFTLLLREKSSLCPVVWKFPAGKGVAGTLWRVYGVEDWWDRIYIGVGIIYGTEGVSGALSCERCLIWAGEKWPIARCSIGKLPADGLHLTLNYRIGVPVCTPKDAAGGVVCKTISRVWSIVIG